MRMPEILKNDEGSIKGPSWHKLKVNPHAKPK
jgi:hypothetical protein